MNIKVTIDDEQVRRNLGNLTDKMKKAMESGMKDLVVAVAGDTIKGSPVDTGNNRRSIRYEAEGLSGSIFSTSGYGGYLETGTAVMSARPYFKPALDKNLPRFGNFIKEHL